MKKITLIISLLMVGLNTTAKTIVNERENLINSIITKMNLNFEGSFAGVDGKKLCDQVKTDLKKKMTDSYKTEELQEIKTTLNDENFNKVNKEVTDRSMKVEDLLLKNPDEEFAKLSSEKKVLANGLEKKLDFKKYSKETVKLLGDKVVESYVSNLPSSIVKSMKSELMVKAQDGMLAGLYEKVALLNKNDLQKYSSSIEKKSFQKYYKDVMDLGIEHANKIQAK